MNLIDSRDDRHLDVGRGLQSRALARHADWLDGLRGIAALLVVFGHCGNFGINVIPFLDLTASAKAGVWVFFMLSAFLLIRKMTEQIEAGIPSMRIIKAYAVRRLLRIMPLYLLLLLVLGMVNYQGSFGWLNVVHHALLLEGWQHLWTISVEMKFYLLVPMFAFALAFTPRPRRIVLATLMLAASLIAYVWSPYPRISGNPLGLQAYLVFFTLGIFVLVASEHVNFRFPISIAAAGLAVVIATHPRLISALMGMPMERSLELYPASAAGAALVMLAASNSAQLRAFFAMPMLVFTGKVSFGLYLVHYFILPEVATLTWLPARGLIGVLASIAVAWLCYRFVERPFLVLGGRIADETIGGDRLVRQ